MQPEQLISFVALHSSNSFCIDIISMKGLVCENSPASAMDRYFTVTVLEKCATIHLLGNIL